MKCFISIILLLSLFRFSGYSQEVQADSAGFRYNSFATIDVGQGTLFLGLSYGQYIINTKKFKTSLSVGVLPLSNNNFIIALYYKNIYSFGNHHFVAGIIPSFASRGAINLYYRSNPYVMLDLGYKYQKPFSRFFGSIEFTPLILNWDGRHLFPWGGVSLGYNFNSSLPFNTKYAKSEKSKFFATSNIGFGMSYWHSSYMISSYYYSSSMDYSEKKVTNPTFSTPAINYDMCLMYQPGKLYFLSYFSVTQYFIKDYYDLHLFIRFPHMYSFGLGIGYPIQLNTCYILNIQGAFGRFFLNKENLQFTPISKYEIASFRKFPGQYYNPFEFSSKVVIQKSISHNMSLFSGLQFKYKFFDTWTMYSNYETDPETGYQLWAYPYNHSRFEMIEWFVNVGLNYNF